MDIKLRKAGKVFLKEAKAWHENEQLNIDTGFGRGDAGVAKAHYGLEMSVCEDIPGQILLAAYDDPNLVGYVAFTDIDDQNRNAQLHITVPPKFQGEGYGSAVMDAALEYGFGEGLYRIEFNPNKTNRRAVEFAKSKGFKLEAITKSSLWTEDGPQDQAQMRILRPEWRKRNRGDDA